MAKCTPEELVRLSKLIVSGKVGETYQESVVQDITKGIKNPSMAYAWPLRILRHAFGEDAGVKFIDPLVRETVVAQNFVNKYRQRSFEVFKENGLTNMWGIKPDADTQVWEALKFVSKGGKTDDLTGRFTPEVIATAKSMRVIYDELFTKFGIDPDRYIQGYHPLIKQRPNGIFRDPQGTVVEETFKAKLSQNEIQFYHELERKGILRNPDERFTAGFESYINGLARAKIIKPKVDQLEQEYVNDYFNTRFIRTSNGQRQILVNDAVGYNAWRDTVHTIFGGPRQLDIIVGDQLKKLVNATGYGLVDESGLRALHTIGQTISSLFYSGAIGSPLGGRPSSVIQQLHSLVRSYSELGSVYTAKGLTEALKFDPAITARLMEKGMLSSPIEKLLEQTTMTGKVGRGVSATTDAFLKVFSATDHFMRVTTLLGSEAKFEAYQQAGNLEKLSVRKAFRDEFQKLISQGKFDEAKERYMFENVANLEYVYGNANRPQVFRGAIGQIAGMLSTFPLNTIELYRMFGQRALESFKTKGQQGDPLPLLRLVGVTAALMYTGSQFMGMDMSNAMMGGALNIFNFGLPGIKPPIDIAKVGATNLERAWSNIYGIGETNFHRMKREEAQRNFLRDFKAFVPGGVFFFNDIPKIVDGQALSTILGFQPLAEARDELAREKAKEKREQSK